MSSSRRRSDGCHKQAKGECDFRNFTADFKPIYKTVINFSLISFNPFSPSDAILTYALLGTAISSLATALGLFGLLKFVMPNLAFGLSDCLYFGALISATDPVTVLAIFGDLHVHSDLHALVLGESILNDAVAIVLTASIERFSLVLTNTFTTTSTASTFTASATGRLLVVGSIGLHVLWLLAGSLSLGLAVAMVSALCTKFSRLNEHPMLESSLLVLTSYACFLCAELFGLSGIVALLSCGICHAHYTARNLSRNSSQLSLQLFELLSFIAENFLFTYLGVSLFTFPKHRWDMLFVVLAAVAVLFGRAANIYPLSLVMNACGRRPRVPARFQHVLFTCGLRGAMAYALAIRSTLTEARQLMLTTTSLLAIVSVISSGAYTPALINWLQIPCEQPEESQSENRGQSSIQSSPSTTGREGIGVTKPAMCEDCARKRRLMLTGDDTSTNHKPIITANGFHHAYDNPGQEHEEGHLRPHRDPSTEAMFGRAKPQHGNNLDEDHMTEDLRSLANGSDDDQSIEYCQTSMDSMAGKYPDDYSLEPGRISRRFVSIDRLYIRPLLTNDQPCLLDTLPASLHWLGRCLTTEKQLTGRHQSNESRFTVASFPNAADRIHLEIGESHYRFCVVCDRKLTSSFVQSV